VADSTVAWQIEGYTPGVAAAAPDHCAGEGGGAAACTAQEQAEERALVAALRAGEQDAYETLIERYEQPVFSIVSRVMDHAGEAADVTQEVFLKVFRKIDAFRGESTLKTWIYRIAVNEAHNHRRWFGRHRRQEVALEPEDGRQGVCDLVADRGPSPYEVARDQETHRLIENALKRISVQYRAALVLREVEGLRYEEIAEILEVSLGTVKSRILRGREALRKVLAEELARTQTAPEEIRARFSGFGRHVPVPTKVTRSAARTNTFEPSSLEGSQWYER
jgi:RNA polymerase sigma-70 factor, ECF subfamily